MDEHLNGGRRNGDQTDNVLLFINSEVRRLDDLRAAEVRRIDEKFVLIEHYNEKLSYKESGRLDAVRLVDVGNVAIAREKADAQAAVLATNVAQSAEAQRALIASTALTLATSQAQLADAFSKRLTVVEIAQSQTAAAKSVSSQVLMMIAAAIGGIGVFLIQRLF